MTEEPHQIILDFLRAIRSRIDDIQADVHDIKQTIISLRTEVHGLRGDLLRQERAIAGIETDMDRIKARLDLDDTFPPEGH